ncbi:hypothetical protein BH10CYA1_BH10CYA1_06900 [soil metagenome]
MQRAARLMNFKRSINYVVRLVAILILLVAALPNSASCTARANVNSMAVHSCCAPSASTCNTAVISNGCCCKAAPVDRAATPGLIASSTTPFFAVAVLPHTPLPRGYYAQSVVCRDSVIATASPPKRYIFYRALLI